MAGQSSGRSVYGVASYSRLRRLSQSPDKVLFLKPNMPTGIRETAWRSAGADVGITIDSIVIVESNRALGLAPWGRCSGAHGALFKETLERYVLWLDISTTPNRSRGAGLLSRCSRSRSLRPRPDELHRLGDYFELRALSTGLLVVPLIKL